MIRGTVTLSHDSTACADNAELYHLLIFVAAGMACVKTSAPWATAKDVRILEGSKLGEGLPDW